MTDLLQQKVKGLLATYYLYLSQSREIDLKIQLERSQFDAKAIVYDKDPSGSGGPTHDARLADMVCRINELEAEKNNLLKHAAETEKQLGLTRLSVLERQMLDEVFQNSSTYEATGSVLGYSKTQVYRMLMKVYHKIYTYVD